MLWTLTHLTSSAGWKRSPVLLKRRFDILARGGVETHPWFRTVCDEIQTAISLIVAPVGSDKFSINPVRSANGVKPIKLAFVECLKKQYEWGLEVPLPISSSEADAGPIDAAKIINDTGKWFAVEWETGNISSSHRALNKIALGILKGQLVGGALILPSRKLYRFLTDRVGNFNEIEPYFRVWGKLDYGCECVISVFEVEHDIEDGQMPFIPKGKDGMAKGLVGSRGGPRNKKKRA
jgi:hypothetical protein